MQKVGTRNNFEFQNICERECLGVRLHIKCIKGIMTKHVRLITRLCSLNKNKKFDFQMKFIFLTWLCKFRLLPNFSCSKSLHGYNIWISHLNEKIIRPAGIRTKKRNGKKKTGFPLKLICSAGCTLLNLCKLFCLLNVDCLKVIAVWNVLQTSNIQEIQCFRTMSIKIATLNLCLGLKNKKLQVKNHIWDKTRTYVTVGPDL